MKEFELEFYAYLGLLSVKFAKMEYNLSVILGKLIGSDENLITVTLIEKNNLTQNIDCLKKINKIRKYQVKAMSNIIDQINRIKNDRNLFIHGIWGVPFESENDIKIVCEERKIRYTEEQDVDEKVIIQSWKYNEHHVIRLTYIKKLIIRIENLLLSQDYLIKELEFETFI